MEAFVINGGKSLKGEIEVRGSKNAALPILAATLLSTKASIIDNIPLIEDVKKMLELMESLGATVEWLGKRKVRINPRYLDTKSIDQKLVTKLRASVLLIAPLSRLGKKFKLAQPGGCFIGIRSIDTHLDAIQQMGVKIRKTPKFYYYDASHVHSGLVTLREFSVTATENILMLAAITPGKTVLKMGALEPQIEDLVCFLRKMGARIKVKSPHTYEIEGKKNLKGVNHRIIPDFLEAGTFMAMGLASHGHLLIRNARPDHLDIVIKKLQEMGGRIQLIPKRAQLFDIMILPSYNLKGMKIQTQPYPGLPTDLQPPFGVLFTQANGVSIIFDTMFEGRLKYIDTLIKMGVNAIIAGPHRAIINGPTPLYAQDMNSLDIRSGISLLMAAMIAKGKSIIKEAYQVDRGYEQIDERLRKLGVDIQRIELNNY